MIMKQSVIQYATNNITNCLVFINPVCQTRSNDIAALHSDEYNTTATGYIKCSNNGLL